MLPSTRSDLRKKARELRDMLDDTFDIKSINYKEWRELSIQLTRFNECLSGVEEVE